MDSGACLCVVPRDPKIHKEIDPEIRIQGANSKPIPVYAIHKCTFQFGETTIRWLVLACDVDSTIIGSDLMDKFGIDVRYSNHTFAIANDDGTVRELAPWATCKSQKEPGVSEVKWQDPEAAKQFYDRHWDEFGGEFRQILAHICSVKSDVPPALEDFTDARTTTKLTREEVEA